MTYYSRFRAIVEKADNASIANAVMHAITVSKSFDEGFVCLDVEATTGPATTLNLGQFTTIYYMALENLGVTAASCVTATYQNAAGASVVVKIPISAEGLSAHITPDIVVAANLVLTSSVGVIPCRVSILGT